MISVYFKPVPKRLAVRPEFMSSTCLRVVWLETDGRQLTVAASTHPHAAAVNIYWEPNSPIHISVVTARRCGGAWTGPPRQNWLVVTMTTTQLRKPAPSA